jgi:hypothetical protein
MTRIAALAAFAATTTACADSGLSREAEPGQDSIDVFEAEDGEGRSIEVEVQRSGLSFRPLPRIDDSPPVVEAEVQPLSCPAFTPEELKGQPMLAELGQACAAWMQTRPFAYAMARAWQPLDSQADPYVIRSLVQNEVLVRATVDGQVQRTGPTMLGSFHEAAKLLRADGIEVEIGFDALEGGIDEIAIRSAGGAWMVMTQQVTHRWESPPTGDRRY